MSSKPTTTARGPTVCVMRRVKDGKTKIVQTRGHRWLLQAEKVFIEHLAATANVRAASAEAGFSQVTVYKQRMANPGFAALAGDAGNRRGAARNVAGLFGGRDAGGAAPRRRPLDPAQDGGGCDERPETPPGMVKGGKPQRYAWRMELPPIEQEQAEIMQRLEALNRGRGW